MRTLRRIWWALVGAAAFTAALLFISFSSLLIGNLASMLVEEAHFKGMLGCGVMVCIAIFQMVLIMLFAGDRLEEVLERFSEL